jgi:hypothetical protein
MAIRHDGSTPSPSASLEVEMPEQMSLADALAVIYFMGEPHHAELVAKKRLNPAEQLAYEHAQLIVRKAAWRVIAKAEEVCTRDYASRPKRLSASAQWAR